MNNYDDIIGLSPPVSEKYPRMPRAARAAQFAPFAALNGYEEAIDEVARLTEEKISLSEEEILRIADKLYLIKEHLHLRPEVNIRYFVDDSKKAGGKYLSFIGRIYNIDELTKRVILEGGTSIPMDNIFGIESPLLDQLEITL